MSSTDLLKLSIIVPFPSEKEALIAYNSLRVDSEPKRSACTRFLSQDHNLLKAEFTAPEAKNLRVYWAIAVPVYFLVTLALVGIFLYPAINLYLTPAPEERCILTDSYTLSEPPSSDREVPPPYDIPMTTVSRILYLDNT